MTNENAWFKKHVDTAVVLVAVVGAAMWMNGQINKLEKDITIIKTVLIMREMMPKELALQGDGK